MMVRQRLFGSTNDMATTNLQAINRWFWQLYVEPVVGVKYEEWSRRRLHDQAWSYALLGEAGLRGSSRPAEDILSSVWPHTADDAREVRSVSDGAKTMRRKDGSEGFETVDDEESVGTKGSGNLTATVQVHGSKRRFSNRASAKLEAGSVIRVSIVFGGKGSKTVKRAARILAFVDSVTGEGVVRMGMWDTSRSTKGSEVGPQVVWRSEVPVVKIDSED